MTIRHSIRALRLYYKSKNLVNQAFVDARRFWWFPLFGDGSFRPRSGAAPITIPRPYWKMLPTAGRLVLLGARPEWHEEKLQISLRGHQFIAPARDKSVATSLREIFIDDVYRMNDQELTDRTVLDLGANIGDSSIAFAARGARVHAFEPLPVLQNYLRDNICLNGMTERIAIHPVGLSNADAVIRTWIKVDGTADASALPLETSKNERAGRIPQELRLVDAVPYCRSQGIAKVDVLKVDCEGCEYALFSNTDLIDFLTPQRIVMEYHRGGVELFHFLSDRGYRVDWTESETEVGYMYAVRMK